MYIYTAHWSLFGQSELLSHAPFLFHSHSLKVLTTGERLSINQWYSVSIYNLGNTSQSLRIEINEQQVPHSMPAVVGIAFEDLDDPLFIGGHPTTAFIQVNFLRSSSS